MDVNGQANEALLLNSQILGLKPPIETSLRAFKAKSEPQPRKTMLCGCSSHILDDEKDLIALQVPADQDRLLTIIRTYLPWQFIVSSSISTCKSFLILPQTSSDGRVAYISEQKLVRFVTVVSTLLAAILMIGFIIVLNYAKARDRRLVVIGIFTVTFAGSVGLLTNARRVEVFAATAAYAAVLVVFMDGSTRLGNN